MKILRINNQLVDLHEDTDIKIKYQVSDIGAIQENKCTFSDSFSVPKTANNIKIFEGLSLVGDTSRKPYQKNSCTYQVDGATLISDGWAVIENTDEEFNIHIYEGVIDLYKDIENKNIGGGELDLSKANHIKNLDTVIDSFSNEYYRYLLADYNGNIYFNNAINIDYLVPSIRLKYIIDEVANKYQWKFKGSVFSNPDYLNSWITYPKPTIAIEDSVVTILSGARNYFTKKYTGTIKYEASQGGFVEITTKEEMQNDTSYKNWNVKSEITTDGQEDGYTLVDNWGIRVPENSPNTLDLSINMNGYVDVLSQRYDSFGTSYDPNNETIKPSHEYVTFTLEILVNGNVRAEVNSFVVRAPLGDPITQAVSGNITLYNIVANDVINYRIKPTTGGDLIGNSLGANQWNSPVYVSSTLYLFDLSISINALSAGEANFQEVLKDFKITDLFKKFVTDFGLSIYTDKYEKIATFLTMDERINQGIIYNYTKFFSKRTDEVYQLDNYAQINWFKYKYNDSNSSYHDGAIKIDDINLEDETTLFESKLYSPEKETNQINSMEVPVCKIWEKQIEEKEDVITVKYKELDKRFYILRQSSDKYFNGNYISEILKTNSRSVTNAPVATFEGLSYHEIITKNWKATEQILNDVRLHTILLALPTGAIEHFDLAGIFYFEQEGMYYIPNSLTVSKSKIEGVFIRVKSDVLSTCPIITTFDIVPQDNPTERNQLFKITLPYVNGYINKVYYRSIYTTEWTKAAVNFTTDGVNVYTSISLPYGLYDFRFQLDNGRCSNIDLEGGVGRNSIGIEKIPSLPLTWVKDNEGEGITISLSIPPEYLTITNTLDFVITNYQYIGVGFGNKKDPKILLKVKGEDNTTIKEAIVQEPNINNGSYTILTRDQITNNSLIITIGKTEDALTYEGLMNACLEVVLNTTEGIIHYQPKIDTGIRVFS